MRDPDDNPGAEGAVEFDGVTKRYGDGPLILSDLALAIPAGEFVTIIGPSGCGKSTLLRLVAGLAEPTSGAVRVWGQRPETVRARMAFIFQEATLLPWLTVRSNIAVPLALRGVRRAGREAALARLLPLVGLEQAAHYYPRQLSGGMKMRVSLARALTLSPDLLLLDEPFGALDAMTRHRLNEELLRIRQRQSWTALFVTHSVQEAVFLSSQVWVMAARPGRLHARLEIPIPYPRAPELRQDRAFLELTAEVSRRLRETETA